MNVYYLYDVHYQMQLNGGCRNDIWGIHGDIFDHPRFENGSNVMISSPKILIEKDENGDMVIGTACGSKYIISSLSMNKDKFIEQVKSDIARGEYEFH